MLLQVQSQLHPSEGPIFSPMLVTRFIPSLCGMRPEGPAKNQVAHGRPETCENNADELRSARAFMNFGKDNIASSMSSFELGP